MQVAMVELTEMERLVLETLRDCNGYLVTVRRLAEMVCYSRATVSIYLRRLEEYGLVERPRGPNMGWRATRRPGLN